MYKIHQNSTKNSIYLDILISKERSSSEEAGTQSFRDMTRRLCL